MFYPLGSCDNVEKEKQIIEFVSRLSPQSKTIKLVDRDDRSQEEIEELKAEGVNVLSRRHIEAYLLDDDVLKKWCAAAGKADKTSDMLAIKQTALLLQQQPSQPQCRMQDNASTLIHVV